MALVCVEADLLYLLVYLGAYALLAVGVISSARNPRRIPKEEEEEATLTESDSEEHELVQDETEAQQPEDARALPKEVHHSTVSVRKSPRSSSRGRRRICAHCSEKHAWSVDHGADGDYDHVHDE